jgi:hypothetical protein
LIYKKGQNGYELIGKESYERAANFDYQTMSQKFAAVGNIQINKAGTIFVSGHSDNTVRVF